MEYLGQGIAFAAIVAGTVTLEIHDKETSGLWVLIVVWVLLATWAPK